MIFSGRLPTSLVLVFLLGFSGLFLSGCATAPATGETFFTGGLSEEDEIQMGAKEHPKILKAFGGEYGNLELKRYVQSIGELLARTSEMPNLKFTFTVLDTPVVNAFALPGGYVYVTRGLLSLANSEAELAGVIGHEIGHVTARHSAQRYGSAIGATVAQVGIAILLGGEVAQASSALFAPALQSFSRSQEFEADTLGVRYISRVGYETEGMASFLDNLLAHSRLEAEMAGRPGAADEFNIMQTHPRTSDRVREATKAAQSTPVGDPIVAREIFLGKIDGMTYDDSTAQGFVRGQKFVHKPLDFFFEVPNGFRLSNSPRAVQARHPDGAVMVFDSGGAHGGSMSDYLRRVWLSKVRLLDLQGITINGMEAATARAQTRSRNGTLDLRFVAIRHPARNAVYRFVFAVRADRSSDFARDVSRIAYSFRRLEPGEADRYRPYRIVLHEVQPGETIDSLARRVPYSDFKGERLRVLNGLRAGQRLQAGQIIKLIVE